MAIVKNLLRVSRLDGEISSGSRYGVYSGDDDDEAQSQSLEFDGTDASEADSGMGSDDCDALEMGEAGSEYCQVGNHGCLIPLELYDLPDLSSILSVETWNSCLTEEERFSLARYLPDMDQETFSLTLRELFSGHNLHFGSPTIELFNRLKGGLFEPRVDLYRRCLNSFLRNKHYHRLCKYQNSMVDSLVRMRDAWENYTGYGIEERLRLLNILRSRRPLRYMSNADQVSETDSENGESGRASCEKRIKMGRQSIHPMRPSFDVSSHATGVPLEQTTKQGEEYPRGILKVAGMHCSSKSKYTETEGKPPSLKHGLKTKHKPSASPLTPQRQDLMAGFELGCIKTSKNVVKDVDRGVEEQLYRMNEQYESKAARGSLLKQRKKPEPLKRDARHAFAGEDQETVHHFDRSKDSNYLSTAAYYDRYSLDSPSKGAYTELNSPEKDNPRSFMPKGEQIGRLAGRKLYHRQQIKDVGLDMGLDRNIKSKKRKAGLDLKVNDFNTVHAPMAEFYSHSDHKVKKSIEKAKGKSSHNRPDNVKYIRGRHLFAQGEATESESSEEGVKIRDIKSLDKKLKHQSHAPEDSQFETVKTVPDSRKVEKHKKKIKKGQSQYHHQNADAFLPEEKGKTKSSGTSLQGYVSGSVYASAKVSGDHKPSYKKAKKGKVHDKHKEGLELPLSKLHSAERKRKAVADLDYALIQTDYRQNNATCIQEDEKEEDSDESPTLVYEQMHGIKSRNRVQVTENRESELDRHEKSNMVIFGCSSSVTKRRKEKAEERHLDELEETDYGRSSRRQISGLALTKKVKKRENSGPGSLSLVTSNQMRTEKKQVDTESKPSPLRNRFTLITPTVHTGFSFSIIHLLSAVRKTMISISVEEASEMVSHHDKNYVRQRPAAESGDSASQSNGNLGGGSLDGQQNWPFLTIQEIVNCVRANPGDPCILETQEPLEDLVRGVLKIFSSKTAPLGAKGWKALVLYEKSTKSWSWVGPAPSSLSDHDTVEEETSSEAWGIPHKMLVKLVDAFANWLTSIQETLKQIGSLPAPPVVMLPNMDEKERFKDLRAQKSLVTISPSSDEVRAYFRREEFLRYSIPDRAFSYTAVDGRKSIVAPLRRGSGKPTSKARDHFMLKPDRPPHVTILCLVRDAAARLPGSIGTRADVCTLIRDSQYLVEDVSDAQVNSVVSGALDRLHYEQDPCVQFDGDRKLWVYLHRDREEEDFEDYGTTSTKKSRRPRRDANEHADMTQVTDEGYPETGDQDAVGSSGYEFRSDLNVDPSSTNTGKKMQHINNGFKAGMENVDQLIDSRENNMHQGHAMGWEVLGKGRMLCQENSTNEDYDDEVFSRGKHIGLINASLL